MADYTPVYVPGQILTLTASTAILGGQLLEVSGNGTVAPIASNATPSVKYVGVATDDTVSGGRVTVVGRGPVHESVADGTVTAGAEVTSAVNANRQVVAAAAVTTPTPADVVTTRAILGIALTTAADNGKVRWMQI